MGFEPMNHLGRGLEPRIFDRSINPINALAKQTLGLTKTGE